MLVRHKGGRGAATAVECAFILPVTFFLMFGLVVGAMGVFRYQEVCTLARDGARYGNFEICVMNADGSRPQQLTHWAADFPYTGFAPSWSPAGQ